MNKKNNTIRKKILSVILLIVVVRGLAQPACVFEHYSTEDGLPQYNVLDMLQDKRGFMWLATFDGLSKFDGYQFYNYKVQPGDSIPLRSNRFDRIMEDKYGRIWIESYGGEALCFDPATNQFKALSASIKQKISGFTASRISVHPSGLVWILSENSGCFCVTDSMFSLHCFNQEDHTLPGNRVNLTHEDQEGNQWLLTNNGLMCLPAGQFDKGESFFSNENNPNLRENAFFSILEFEDEIWFGSTNGRIERFFKKKRQFQQIRLSTKSEITSICKLDDHQLLVVTANNGFFTCRYDQNPIEFSKPANTTQVEGKSLHVVFLNNPNQLWFSTNELGIYLYDFRTNRLSFFQVPTEDSSAPVIPVEPFILKDPSDHLWVQPLGGGFSIYNEQNNTLEPFYNRPDSPDRRFSNVLHSAYFDRQGNLWFSSKSNGLEKVIFNKSFFRQWQVSEPGSALNSDNVRALFEDTQGNLWVATRGLNRLVLFDRNQKKIGFLSPQGDIRSDANWICATYCIFEDNKHNIWLGTRGDGLFKLTPKEKPFSYQVEHYTHYPTDPNSISDNNIYSIIQDRQQRIWIGTFGGGINLIENNDSQAIRFIHSGSGLENYPSELANKVRCISEDRFGHIWVGTTMGLLIGANSSQRTEDLSFKSYTREPGNTKSLSNNDIISLHLSQQGEMFVGTFGGGMNKAVSLDSKGFPVSFQSFTTKSGLPSDLIQSVEEDQSGKLWISTQTELSRFDPQSENIVHFAEVRSLLSNHYFSEAAHCLTKEGRILFGFSNGILEFEPESIMTTRFSPNLALTNLSLFNKVAPIGAQSPLKVSIDYCKNLVLTHKQNYFTLEYAALDQTNPKAIQYAYKLEGFDKEWNFVQKQRIASYTNLPKGEYVFKVKSTNSQGIWCENERQLPIEIQPSFWDTPLAYALYFIIFGFLIFLIDYNLLTIYRLKSNVKLEKKMSEMKLKFFTDISHEIRTPLTLISSPVDYLLNDNRTPEMVKKQLRYISQNTNRMLQLVNQILDFRKLQESNFTVTEIELAPFVQEIFNLFTELAEEQQIDFSFDNQAPDAKVWADKEGLGKMISNLLSNAFKFGAVGGSIRVVIKTVDKYLAVKVYDNGPGIPKDKQKRLFERFTTFNDDPSKPSTGIGLALVKEIAEKHSAKIQVESDPGKGSCFSLYFLEGNTHFSPNTKIVPHEKQEPAVSVQSKESPADRIADSSSSASPTVLLIEDDTNLRQFLRSILEQEYNILEAEDGLQGFETASYHNPDFIISDIMMPRLDGIELLKKLRSDVTTSHIPIVMLTAKTDIESQLEGLNYGADDYITKPFSVPFFKTRIANLLAQRKRLQTIFSTPANGYHDFHPSPSLITPLDEELIGKILSSIENNIDNSNFSVEELALLVGLGRTTLFKKLKSLTGLSPVEFIRDIRLKRAAQLISDSKLMIKEVAYMTGFSDIKYFNKSFKGKYGMTPVEYRNQHK